MRESKLKEIRKELNLTQSELAKSLGLGVSSVKKKEAGNVPLTIRDLEVLRRVYGVDLNRLV